MSNAPDIVLEHLLPTGWVKEHRFHATRRWRFDYAWIAHLLALEVEGGIWTRGRHTRGAGYQKDIEKYNAAALAGWRVLRISREDWNKGRAGDLIAQAITKEAT